MQENKAEDEMMALIVQKTRVMSSNVFGIIFTSIAENCL
jgi:hypothetical protein